MSTVHISQSVKAPEETTVLGAESDPSPTVAAGETVFADESGQDELPAVGRVWEGGGATSIFAAFKKSAKPAGNIPTSDNVVSADAGDFDALMQRFHAAAAEQAPTVAGFLEGGKIIALDEGTATMEYPKNLAASVRMLDRGGKRESLQDVLSGLIGHPVGIKFSISEHEQAPAPPPPRGAHSPKSAMPSRDRTTGESPPPVSQAMPLTDDLRSDLVKNNPLIKALAEEFNARIVKVE